MTYHPKQIMVTGGAGFIGSHFIRYMLNQYHDIHIVNVDKLTYAGCLSNLNDIQNNLRYTFFQLDICSQVKIEKILQEFNIDTIVHFAAESHVDRSIKNPDAFIRIIIVGKYHLLEAARNALKNNVFRRFHHISTDEVFGSLKETSPSFTESTAYEPNSPYSASKAAADHLVRAYCNTYGLPITLSNCSNNYGPHQHPEKLIPTIIRNCIMEKKIPIYSNGSNIRDWLFVEDHCIAIDKIIREGSLGESYNIGANTELSNLALTQFICQMIAEIKELPVNTYLNLIEFVKDRPGHDFRYAINSEKIISHLGWKPIFNLKEGLTKTIEWYFAQMHQEIIA